MSFDRSMASAASGMIKAIEEHQKAITIAIFNSLIDNTRVKTGRAKGNWQTTEGKPATSQLDDLDPNGSARKADVIANFQPRSLMIISNNLPYIENLERLDSMVDSTFTRLDRIVKENKP